jgi:hypothetical protein
LSAVKKKLLHWKIAAQTIFWWMPFNHNKIIMFYWCCNSSSLNASDRFLYRNQSAHCRTSPPVPSFGENQVFFKEKGSFKEEERLLKEKEAKMTSYNIIKIAAY